MVDEDADDDGTVPSEGFNPEDYDTPSGDMDPPTDPVDIYDPEHPFELGNFQLIANTDRYLSFPSATAVGNRLRSTNYSSFYVIWQDQADHYGSTGPAGPTQYSYSYDGGSLWTKPEKMLGTGPKADGLSAISVSSQFSSIATLYMRSNPKRGYVDVGSAEGERDPPQVHWKNATWTFPSSIFWADNLKKNGVILATCYTASGVALIRSFDRGKTWEDIPNPFPEGYNESAMTQLSDGRIVMMARNDSWDIPGNGIIYSSDYGATWTAPRVAMVGTAAFPAVSALPDADDALVVPLRRRDRPDGTGDSSWGLAVSYDYGLSWKQQYLDSSFMMYGAILPLTGPRFVLVGASQITSTNSDVWARVIKLRRDQSKLAPLPPSDDGYNYAEYKGDVDRERWFIVNFTDGLIRYEVEPIESSWEVTMTSSKMSVSFDWNTNIGKSIVPDIYPWSTAIVMLRGDQTICGGPMMADHWDGSKVTIEAVGVDRWMDRRIIWNPQILDDPNRVWSLKDAREKKKPSWLKVQAKMTWPQNLVFMFRQVKNFTLAKNFPGDATGQPPIDIYWDPWGPTVNTEVDALDFVTLFEYFEKVRVMEGGVEWSLRPQIQGGEEYVAWNLRVGSPYVGYESYYLAASLLEEIQTARDGEHITTGIHLLGGGKNNSVITYNSFGNASPLYLETVDMSYQQVDKFDVLRKFGQQKLKSLSAPKIDVEGSVPAVSLQSGWFCGDFMYLVGDESTRDEYAAKTPHLPAETKVRIMGISGGANSDRVKLQLTKEIV